MADYDLQEPDALAIGAKLPPIQTPSKAARRKKLLLALSAAVAVMGSGYALLADGFSGPEPSGVWTDGEIATVKFRTPRGANVSYVDLSLFQMIEGLRYAFPKTMEKLEPNYPRVVALHDKVAVRPRLKKYLASPRRLAFNTNGIFRHYPELDE